RRSGPAPGAPHVVVGEALARDDLVGDPFDVEETGELLAHDVAAGRVAGEGVHLDQVLEGGFELREPGSEPLGDGFREGLGHGRAMYPSHPGMEPTASRRFRMPTSA